MLLDYIFGKGNTFFRYSEKTVVKKTIGLRTHIPTARPLS